MNSIGTRGQVKRNVNNYKMQLRIKLKFYVSLENIFSKFLKSNTREFLRLHILYSNSFICHDKLELK